MNHNDIEMRILVKGRPITEYNHMGQIFVEGRKGSEYEIEVRNNTYGRVSVILSVDGLSVLDGKEANSNSPAYLIESRSSIRIPGWKVNNETVAHFAFSGKGNGESYATTMTGSSQNNGVIGLLAYKEKPRYVAPVHHIAKSTLWRSINPVSTPTSNPYYDSYGSVTTDSYSPVGGAFSSITGSVSASTASLSAIPMNAVSHGIATASCAPEPTQNLGTQFGKATEFKTSSVEFERGDLLTMMEMFYDDSRGLSARGIQLQRPSRKKYSDRPQAFPGMSCNPPPGWNG